VPENREAPQRSPISGGVLNGKALNLPRPSYPQMAKSSGVTGTVVIEVVIDERGNVSDVRVLSGHPMLRQAALTAARQAKFSPTILSGAPVRVTGTINYTFKP
jgi:protein TonB